jgi:DUF2891 family protein
MKLVIAILLFTVSAAAGENTGQFDLKAADRFASLALACVHKEYPNHIAHALNSDLDVAPPRKLTPAFYGCYDWHPWERPADHIIPQRKIVQVDTNLPVFDDFLMKSMIRQSGLTPDEFCTGQIDPSRLKAVQPQPVTVKPAPAKPSASRVSVPAQVKKSN